MNIKSEHETSSLTADKWRLLLVSAEMQMHLDVWMQGLVRPRVGAPYDHTYNDEMKGVTCNVGCCLLQRIIGLLDCSISSVHRNL